MNPMEIPTLEKKKEENKLEDQKALPKLALFTILSGIFGGCFSGGAIFVVKYLEKHTDENLVELFHEAQMSLGNYAGYIAFALAVILSIVSFAFYKRSKAIVQTQDIDDDDVHKQVDQKLSFSLLLNNLNTLLSFFLFGTAFYCMDLRDTSSNLPLFSIVLAMAGFILQIISTSINQQKVVNLEKEMNPEKKGSVYDFQFHKKWMNSCDEAERFFAYKCAFSAYQATQIVCLVLSLLLTLIGMVFPIGLLPLFCVTIIWGVSTIVYIVQTMKID